MILKNSIFTLFISLTIHLMNPISEVCAQSSMSKYETKEYILKHGKYGIGRYENDIKWREGGEILFLRRAEDESGDGTWKGSKFFAFAQNLDTANIDIRYSANSTTIYIHTIGLRNLIRYEQWERRQYWHKKTFQSYQETKMWSTDMKDFLFFIYKGSDPNLAKIMVKAFKHLIVLLQMEQKLYPKYDDPFK